MSQFHILEDSMDLSSAGSTESARHSRTTGSAMAAPQSTALESECGHVSAEAAAAADEFWSEQAPLRVASAMTMPSRAESEPQVMDDLAWLKKKERKEEKGGCNRQNWTGNWTSTRHAHCGWKTS
eukprot:scpid106947/ scgid5403/ 